ncbi:hypothetical protein [Lactobacillus sp. PV012]|uniref:hypothetical protein n=1 Tax=Lactobacillus sp. PV012 TaxID=2594494 RepID=UPI00223F1EAD|nr:hypothetical protein [Lactobacillus sp. PV012]QNQ81771.1 hypothetical protein FP433_01235 [Lactobacillus sp. PV012]
MKRVQRLILTLVFLGFGVLSLAAKNSVVSDELAVFDQKTTQLLAQRNTSFQRHHEKVHFVLQSNKKAKAIKPQENEMIIFVTKKANKRNVEISMGKNLARIIPLTKRMQILQATKQQLRSADKGIFNRGVQRLINISATLINRHYHVKDKNDISVRQLSKLNTSKNMKILWSLAVGIFAIVALAWYQNFKINH